MKPPTLAVAVLGTFFAVALLTSAAPAQEPRKWATLDEGLAAAKKSGKPLMLLTLWNPGVDVASDSWRERMPEDAEVARQLWRFEQAEWLYDGVGGKVIQWTRANGGTSDDPTVQAFVVLPDVAPETRAVTRAPRDALKTPDAFAKWLKEHADAYEKTHPVPRLAYVAGAVRAQGEGTARTCSIPAVDSARKEDRAVLVFIARSETRDSDKEAKAQAAASKKTEKGFLDSDLFARIYQGWTLIRIDIADPDALAYAKSFGVDKAPFYLQFFPGETEPRRIDPANWGDGPGMKGKKPPPGGGKK